MIAAPGNFVRSGETGEEAYSLLWRMYLRCYAEAKGIMEYLFPALLLTVFALIVCKGILKETWAEIQCCYCWGHCCPGVP